MICGRNTKAMHDVIVNARARWASAEFAVKEVQVQGTEAVPAMLKAFAELDADPNVAVIVFARGGGSVEDLLPFSDEQLVRAVAAASTPVVSAIGHETDNPVLDFVADYRASTPTAAAKRIVPDVTEEKQNLNQALSRMRNAFTQKINIMQNELNQIRQRPIFANPENLVINRHEDIQNLHYTLRNQIQHRIKLSTTDFTGLLKQLRTLSPYSTISRGYSVLHRIDGTIVTSTKEVKANTKLAAILKDGTLALQVNNSQTNTNTSDNFTQK
ncbi:exodeoxyribonuclease VII large subunit [Arcanobacterium hippocoleae]|uniref:exodeoxyribonuclease VII large subunit n=1 Tax=Arcanobacterium hippocoleae TaxID=149017 RepID=UPI003342D023